MALSEAIKTIEKEWFVVSRDFEGWWQPEEASDHMNDKVEAIYDYDDTTKMIVIEA